MSSLAPLLSKSSLLRLPWSSLSALDVWRRHRAVSDLGPFSAGRWIPSQQPVRLSAAVNPKELEGLELDALCAAPAVPGSALVIRRGRKHRLLCVRCRQGWVAFEKIWYANRRPMTPLDFLNGFVSKVQPGAEHEARFQEEDAEES